jgi:hypothetical protein
MAVHSNNYYNCKHNNKHYINKLDYLNTNFNNLLLSLSRLISQEIKYLLEVSTFKLILDCSIRSSKFNPFRPRSIQLFKTTIMTKNLFTMLEILLPEVMILEVKTNHKLDVILIKCRRTWLSMLRHLKKSCRTFKYRLKKERKFKEKGKVKIRYLEGRLDRLKRKKMQVINKVINLALNLMKKRQLLSLRCLLQLFRKSNHNNLHSNLRKYYKLLLGNFRLQIM